MFRSAFSRRVDRADRDAETATHFPEVDGRLAFDIRLFFGCSSVVRGGTAADKFAGSAAARHPAGGSTRRRSKVLVSGGPCSCRDEACRRTRSWTLGVRPQLDIVICPCARKARTDGSDLDSPVSDAILGEVIDGSSRAERFHAAEARIQRVTHVLDDLVPIPGTSQRVGVDPIIGLIPFVGDVTAAIVGGWVILEAARFGVPRIALARMIVNLTVDLAIGLIPIIGDMFDIVSRSNSANLAIFRRHALDPDATTTDHRAFFVGLGVLLVGVIWLTAWLAAALVGRRARVCSR